MTAKSFLKQVKKHTKAIAKQRDELLMLIQNAEEIAADSSEAIEQLESAVDALSRNL